MAFKASHGTIVVDSRRIGVKLSEAPTCYETNLLVHRAINNSVKNSYIKYRFGKSWNCLSAAAKTAENLRFLERLI